MLGKRGVTSSFLELDTQWSTMFYLQSVENKNAGLRITPLYKPSTTMVL